MERLAFWSEECQCWTYKCPSTCVAAALAAYEVTGLTPAEVADIKKQASEIERLNVIAEQRYQLYDAALTTIERLREAQRWIPVTERLPNETDTDDSRDSCVLAIHKKINQRYFNWRTVVNNPFDFTHWMPLPESPEKEGVDSR